MDYISLNFDEKEVCTLYFSVIFDFLDFIHHTTALLIIVIDAFVFIFSR